MDITKCHCVVNVFFVLLHSFVCVFQILSSTVKMVSIVGNMLLFRYMLNYSSHSIIHNLRNLASSFGCTLRPFEVSSSTLVYREVNPGFVTHLRWHVIAVMGIIGSFL